MQALILVGGEGTRLRPLTSTQPKPIVPLAGRPFLTYMLAWLHRHGVREVILACGFLPDAMREVLGDGDALGLRLHYVEEPAPLGTGGALKYAEDLLAERFFMLNGDVLSDIDLTAQLAQHERTGARATLALTPVEDPSAYGLVRRETDLSVREFVEKPRPEQIDTNLINAGAYILERSVLDVMGPAGTNISIEREVFPSLVGRGLFGYEAPGYWLDIGTPDRYLQGTADILTGAVRTETGDAIAAAGGVVSDGAEIAGLVRAPAMIGPRSVVAAGAVVGARTAIGAGVRIAAGARVEGSVLLDGVRVGADATIRGAIIARDVEVGERCQIEAGVVLGEGVRLGADSTLRAGTRIFPGVELPAGAIRS
ncbi:MAG TPA: NDP-sugar synthase [Solirubrobacteraceae bacterium]|nr:NDP-sugar synthase [Solirubrobacteraceae bacterium]